MRENGKENQSKDANGNECRERENEKKKNNAERI